MSLAATFQPGGGSRLAVGEATQVCTAPVRVCLPAGMVCKALQCSVVQGGTEFQRKYFYFIHFHIETCSRQLFVGTTNYQCIRELIP